MKILFVCSGNSSFGISPFIDSQGRSLTKKGIKVDSFRIVGKGLKGYLKNVPELRKLIKTNRYDLIHAHYSLSGWVSVLQSTKTPVVVSFMGSDLYGIVNDSGKRAISGYINMFLSLLLQPFPRHIVVKSRNLSEYIYLKYKMSIIPNGIDFNLFRPIDKKFSQKKLNLNSNKKYLLFLGNKDNLRKNYKLFYQAYKLLDRKDVVALNPYPIPHENVVYYLNAADTVVLTSYLEGSPNVIKEAMACNCPIVSTDVGDVKEVIGDTEGCYITGDDPREVAAKLRLALDFAKRTDGRSRIRHLDQALIAEKLINLYQQVLNGR